MVLQCSWISKTVTSTGCQTAFCTVKDEKLEQEKSILTLITSDPTVWLFPVPTASFLLPSTGLRFRHNLRAPLQGMPVGPPVLAVLEWEKMCLEMGVKKSI